MERVARYPLYSHLSFFFFSLKAEIIYLFKKKKKKKLFSKASTNLMKSL